MVSCKVGAHQATKGTLNQKTIELDLALALLSVFVPPCENAFDLFALHHSS